MDCPEQTSGRTIIGWREWACFPELNIPAIKFKADTGARTSSLHSFSQDFFEKEGRQWVRFGIHPVQKRDNVELYCEAPVVDFREITNSGGQTETRPVISSRIMLGNMEWDIELTLTNRDSMKFRMLLGRTAMEERIIVDPARSYVLGRKLAAFYYK
ncbi:ATP-dependent zinc protease [Maridesulfovibrio sp.]|uniref:ATP-dependent zinc protease family protein n=1 Tax=Maridesulfovibrio sp. TaxID=2795000 RepID=UPI002A18CBAA|nr:ATP-dependent zinc protease [Maridesulfovibrio sp.]